MAKEIPDFGVIHVTEADTSLTELFLQSFDSKSVSFSPGLFAESDICCPEEVVALCVTVRSPIGKAQLDALPNLRFIATGSAGFDHIDRGEARKRGIKVSNVPEYGPAVAEFNIALMIALSRKVHLAYLHTLQRDFTLEGLLGINLFGRTLGIVGTGIIGARVAKIAKAFSMRVLAVDPAPSPNCDAQYVNLPHLLAQADVIALCCPLTSETHHLIGRAEFEQMKRGVLIVNTSRGAVIDTQALVWALDVGIVQGAALDVLEGETFLNKDSLLSTLSVNPTPEQTQTIAEDLTLIRHPKVMVTPHMAFYTEDSLNQIRRTTVANVLDFLDGHPKNLC